MERQTEDRWAAAALVLVGLLTVSPVAALSLTRAGAEWLAMFTQTPTWLVFASAVLQLAAPLLVLTLLLAAWGSLHHLRWAAPMGWAGLVCALGVLWSPLKPLSLASWVPLGQLATTLFAVTAGVTLLRVWREGQPGGFAVALWPVGGFAVAVAAVASIGLVTGGLPGHPLTPSQSAFRAGPGLPTPVAALSQPQNPAMAQFPFAGIHNDAAQTDLYPQPPTLDPRTAVLKSFAAGGTCASITWDSRGNLVTLCVSDAVTAYVLEPTTLSELARYRISSRPVTADFLTDFGGGGYMYLGADDAIVTPTLNRTILVLEQVRTDTGIQLEPSVEYDLSAALLPKERPTSVLPDSAGRIWFVGQLGTVGYINPATGQAVARHWPGEDIENSFATGPDDDVYVVSSRALRRLRATQDEVQVQWESSYDAGTSRKPGQTSAASGTTPTLHGSDWVSIADNGDPMSVDVFRRTDGSRICSVEVFPAGAGSTENSLISLGDDLLVENNYGYSLFDVQGGHSTQPGLVRVAVDGQTGCSVAWRNDEIRIPSAVSKASAGGGIALTYTKDSTWWGVDQWWITAVSLGDGQVVWQRLAGVGVARNNHYAAIYMNPKGGIVVGTLMGVVALDPP